MKIAVLTYSREINCGAALQAWALKRTVERFGHVVDVPLVKGYESRGRWYGILLTLKEGVLSFLRNLAYQCFTIGKKEWVIFRFNKAMDRMLVSARIYVDVLSEYDLIIVGSDQVWNPYMGTYKLPLYLGEVIPREVPLVGYAVSVGDVMPAPCFDSRFLKAVKRFSKVFVREKRTGDFLLRSTGFHFAQTLDPSLLLTMDEYRELEEGFSPDEPYVFFYVLATNDVVKMVPAILAAVGVKRAVFFDGSIDFVPHKKPKGYRRFITPGEFIRLARNARAIVACSFHGVAFSLLSQKPFVALTPQPVAKKFDTRAGDLLRRLDCCERMFSVTESVERMCNIIQKPLDRMVVERLSVLRKESLEMLKDAIDSAR